MGDYIVGDLIARGGYGTVHRARHTVTGQRAAIKVLHDSLADMPKMIERFTREVDLVQRLRHPNIVEILDVGALEDGRPYYVMEFIEGRTLASMLEEQGRVSPTEALALLEPVCAALAAAHAAGVVHRDVKAGNIIVGAGEPRAIKLLDFGIAKLLTPEPGASGLTTVGRPIGTLAIMAPEQILGEPLDARVDVYALGVLLYRMLTGRGPFAAQTPQELVSHHLESLPARPSTWVPLALPFDAVILRCLEKRREQRYGSVMEFLAALRDATLGPAAMRDSTPPVFVEGVALHVEIRVRAGGDWDDALDRDLGVVADQAEEALRSAGMTVVVSTGTEVLGVQSLRDGAAAGAADRAAVLALGARLRARLDARADADPRVHVNLAVHTGRLILRGGEPLEVLGGELTLTARWVPRADVAGLCATRAAVAGVSGLELRVGPGDLLIVTQRDGDALAGLESGPGDDAGLRDKAR